MSERLTLAVPNKGRLREPSLELLTEAGLAFELTERALSVPVGNVELDLLFVRTDDIPEMVADGAAELGITGLDLLGEHGGELPVLAELGFGRCRLAVAVPAELAPEKPEDLVGMRVATAHPRLVERWFDDRAIPVTVIPLRGSVEVAPKLGLADAVVDLVSSGSTLRVNGLRVVGTLVESQAVLIGRSPQTEHPTVTPLVTAVRAVVAARRQRYLLLNAPAGAVETIVGLIPGLEAPTVVPLAEPGWVAIHSVVEADHLWELLPRLEASGGRGILVLRIEQMIP